MKVTFQTNSDGIYIKSLGSFDDTKRLNLNIIFSGINFQEMLEQNQFKEFVIEGQHIKSIGSDFSGISIPSGGNILSLKIIPKPLTKMKINLYFKGNDISLSDVEMEYYIGHKGEHLIKLKHKSLTMEIEDSKKRFNFKFKEFSTLKEFNETVEFLLELAKGTDSLYVYLLDIQQEYELLQMNSRDNVTFVKELQDMIEMIEKLKVIQRHYRINFNNFEVSFSENVLEFIDILYSDILGEVTSVNSIYFSTDKIEFTDPKVRKEDFIKRFIKNKETLGIESTLNIGDYPLFGAMVPVNKKLVLKCEDSIVIHSKKIKDSHFAVEVKSKAQGIKRYLI